MVGGEGAGADPSGSAAAGYEVRKTSPFCLSLITSQLLAETDPGSDHTSEALTQEESPVSR
eukprot:COSAG06_NODE_1186_length_10343_cov_19.170929_13_plen_61_part_00